MALCMALSMSLVSSAETANVKITLDNLPAYSDSAYVELNYNKPKFKTSEKINKKAFEKYSELDELGQHRIIIVVRLRSQIFRQIVLKRRRRADARQGVLVQYDGKCASKRAAKALAGNCAVLP